MIFVNKDCIALFKHKNFWDIFTHVRGENTPHSMLFGDKILDTVALYDWADKPNLHMGLAFVR